MFFRRMCFLVVSILMEGLLCLMGFHRNAGIPLLELFRTLLPLSLGWGGGGAIGQNSYSFVCRGAEGAVSLTLYCFKVLGANSVAKVE